MTQSDMLEAQPKRKATALISTIGGLAAGHVTRKDKGTGFAVWLLLGSQETQIANCSPERNWFSGSMPQGTLTMQARGSLFRSFLE